MPVRGMTRVTPPIIMKLCIPKIDASPPANNFENGRVALIATLKLEPTSSNIALKTAIAPIKPSSSPTAEKIKSLAALGICCGLPTGWVDTAVVK